MRHRQRVLEVLAGMPSWARPIWLQMGQRLVDGVTIERAACLFWQEIGEAAPPGWQRPRTH